jgi:FkbM family methyltransferase
MQHHEVFRHFEPYHGELPEDFQVDCLGTKISQQFVAGLTRIVVTLPEIDEEYFEWIDVLESVIAAKDTYTMIDLGAGYGRWAVRAAYAAKQYNPTLSCQVIAAEAEPVVFQWMRQHFQNNGLDPDQHRLIHAAVSNKPEKALFYIGGPRGGAYDRSPSAWYGQFLTQDYDEASESVEDGEYSGFKVTRHKSGWRSILVPSISLDNILNDVDKVDLIDMDIEGQELPAIQLAIEKLNKKVKRLHIGTHSKEIEAALRQLLSSHEWRCLADYTLFSTSETPWGTISFENGVQTWVNPRL